MVLRTLTSAGFATFMPVLLTSQGMSIAHASLAGTCYLLVSGVGGFAGGPLADRFGPRRVILVSLISSVPFMVAASQLTGWWFTAAISIGGLLLQSTLPVNVTYAQMLAPVGAATVSSLMMGFAWGVGSVMVPVVGLLGDVLGLPTALLCISGVPLLAAALAAQLPERARDHAPSGGPHLTTAPPPYNRAMSRYGNVAYSMGPGPLSHAVKTLIAINVAGFLLGLIVPAVTVRFGLHAGAMFMSQFALWQPSPTCSCMAASATCSSTCWRSGCSAPSSSAPGARASSCATTW